MGKLELIDTLKGHEDRVWNGAWHPKGDLLGTCGEDKKILIWAKDFTGKWSLKNKLTEGHKRTIREINWSPCGNFLASASFDATIGIWDKNNGNWECNSTLEGHENEVKSVAWAPSGQVLATCSRDKSVWVWEVAGDDYECAAVLNAHTQDVKKVRWHPDAEILASASYDNSIKMFKEDLSDNDWTCFATLTSHESTVWSVAFDASGSRLASVSDDKMLKIWREYKPGNEQGVPTKDGDSAWKLTATISGYHTRTIYDVDWCKKTGALVTACGDDAIRVFQETPDSDPHAPSFELATCVERAHNQDVNAVVWNPVDPGLLVSCGDDGFVKLWRYTEMNGSWSIQGKPSKLLPNLQDIVRVMEKWAPKSVAESWDNVGLLTEPQTPLPTEKVLLANDLTENVAAEAVDKKVNLIISYHPPIFKGLKSITTGHWKERVIGQCIENKIAIYSPHTSWDCTISGVSDWLIKPNVITFSDVGVLNNAGRVYTLEKTATVQEIINRYKVLTGLETIPVALGKNKNLDSVVERIACCAGSGASVLSGSDADLWVTGEMSHHEILDAVHNNATVVLLGHSHSERGFLKCFGQLLQEQFPALKIFLSESDIDPIRNI